MSPVYAGRMDRRTDMRAVVQRVSKAAVSVDQQEIGKNWLRPTCFIRHS